MAYITRSVVAKSQALQTQLDTAYKQSVAAYSSRTPRRPRTTTQANAAAPGLSRSSNTGTARPGVTKNKDTGKAKKKDEGKAEEKGKGKAPSKALVGDTAQPMTSASTSAAVRQQLQDTTIDGSKQNTAGAPVAVQGNSSTAPTKDQDDFSAPVAAEGDAANATTAVEEDRTAHLQKKKRGHETVIDGETGDSSNTAKHPKKRSRELANDDGKHSSSEEEDATQDPKSTETKTAPAQSSKDVELPDRPDAPEAASSGTTDVPHDTAIDTDATVAQEMPPPKIPATSGFANAAENSPFSLLANNNAQKPQTTLSSFGSFAASKQKGFGNFGASNVAGDNPSMNGNSFSPSKTPAAAPALSFGSGATQAFGGPAAGFGGLGGASGFGGAGFGAGGFSAGTSLNSFATPGDRPKPVGLGEKAAKTFGAPAINDYDEEQADDHEDDDPEAAARGDAHEAMDKRFYTQSIDNGEEGEENLFSERAKLYVNIDKQWKERGVGTFRFNIKPVGIDDDVDTADTAEVADVAAETANAAEAAGVDDAGDEHGPADAPESGNKQARVNRDPSTEPRTIVETPHEQAIKKEEDDSQSILAPDDAADGEPAPVTDAVIKEELVPTRDLEQPMKATGRFIMRADATQRLVLNSPVNQGTTIQDRNGGKPVSQVVKFMATSLEGKPLLCMLKFRTVEMCEKLEVAVDTFKTQLMA